MVAGINWIINAKSTDIRQRSFALSILLLTKYWLKWRL